MSDGDWNTAVRLYNAEAMQRFISKQNIPEGEPIIIGGNFNFDIITMVQSGHLH